MCNGCGAGLCSIHADSVAQTVQRVNGLGTSTRSLPGRRILCGTCLTAERSA
jgi:hypothetical protein